MLGGVTVNFILAAVIYIFMAFFYGSSDVDANSVKGGYAIYNPVLQEIGLKDGDKVLAINDYKIEYFSDIRKYILEAETMTIEREGQQQTINFPVDFLGQLSASKKRGLIELRQPFIFDSFAENSINEGVDLRKGDIFKTINGQSAEFFDEVVSILQTLKNQTATATLERDGALISRELQINSEGAFALFVSQSMNDYQDAGYFDIIKKQYDFGESIGVGLDRFISQISSYWMQLKLIFSPSTGAYKGVGGFMAIFDIFPDTWSWESFWGITAYLSIMLGVLNLLPIPALDGGHVMFLLYEMVSGRKPGDKFMEYAQTVGFFILIALVLFANGNDIFKAFFG
jgi:regulator of sigma E protease